MANNGAFWVDFWGVFLPPNFVRKMQTRPRAGFGVFFAWDPAGTTSPQVQLAWDSPPPPRGVLRKPLVEINKPDSWSSWLGGYGRWMQCDRSF